jgi:AcrR family transcriptional regulator
MPTKKTSRTVATPRPRVRRGSEADAERLRAELLATALALFIEGGLEAVTMRAVATRVGVSAMTPYRYFEDKGHLLRGIWHHVLGQAVDAMRASAAGIVDVNDRIRANLNGFIDYWEAHPQHYRLVYMTDQTLRADAQGVFTQTPAYAGVIDETLETSRQLAAQIGGDPAHAKLASDIRFMMVSAYLHSRLVNRRYPWTAADVLRPAVIELIIEAMASCLRKGPQVAPPLASAAPANKRSRAAA